jgi:hypothetical protein
MNCLYYGIQQEYPRQSQSLIAIILCVGPHLFDEANSELIGLAVPAQVRSVRQPFSTQARAALFSRFFCTFSVITDQAEKDAF